MFNPKYVQNDFFYQYGGNKFFGPSFPGPVKWILCKR